MFEYQFGHFPLPSSTADGKILGEASAGANNNGWAFTLRRGGPEHVASMEILQAFQKTHQVSLEHVFWTMGMLKPILTIFKHRFIEDWGYIPIYIFIYIYIYIYIYIESEISFLGEHRLLNQWSSSFRPDIGSSIGIFFATMFPVQGCSPPGMRVTHITKSFSGTLILLSL